MNLKKRIKTIPHSDKTKTFSLYSKFIAKVSDFIFDHETPY